MDGKIVDCYYLNGVLNFGHLHLFNTHISFYLSLLVTLLIYHIYYLSLFYSYLTLGVKWDWDV